MAKANIPKDRMDRVLDPLYKILQNPMGQGGPKPVPPKDKSASLGRHMRKRKKSSYT